MEIEIIVKKDENVQLFLLMSWYQTLTEQWLLN